MNITHNFHFTLLCKGGDLFGWDTIQEYPNFPAIEINYASSGEKNSEKLF